MKYYEFVLNEDFWLENWIGSHYQAICYLKTRLLYLQCKLKREGEVTLIDALDAFSIHYNPEWYMKDIGFNQNTGIKIKVNKKFMEADNDLKFISAYLRFYCIPLHGVEPVIEEPKEQVFYDTITGQTFKADFKKIAKAMKTLNKD